MHENMCKITPTLKKNQKPFIEFGNIIFLAFQPLAEYRKIYRRIQSL